MARSILNRVQQDKVVAGLREQGVTIEPGRMGHWAMRFADGSGVTMNLTTSDRNGITRAQTVIRGKGLRWPLDAVPKERKLKVEKVIEETLQYMPVSKPVDLTKTSPIHIPPPADYRPAVVPTATHSTTILEEWIDLTPELAQKFLAKNFDNRSVRQAHVSTLARDMAAGNWRATGEAIKFDYNDRLIDGQHRLKAVIASGATIRVLLILGLDPDVREVIDTPSHRSARDALRFEGHVRYTTTIAGAAKVGILFEAGYWRNALDTHNRPVSNLEVIEWVNNNPRIHEWPEFATKTATLIDIQSPSTWLYCLYVLSAIDEEGAREFASSLAELRTTGPGDPRLALLNAIRTARSTRRRMAPAEVIYLVFRTWNAWRKEEALRKLQPSIGGENGTLIPRPI